MIQKISHVPVAHEIEIHDNPLVIPHVMEDFWYNEGKR